MPAHLEYFLSPSEQVFISAAHLAVFSQLSKQVSLSAAHLMAFPQLSEQVFFISAHLMAFPQLSKQRDISSNKKTPDIQMYMPGVVCLSVFFCHFKYEVVQFRNDKFFHSQLDSSA